MEHKEFKESIADYITENCSKQKKIAIEQFLKENPASKQEVEEMKILLNGFDEEFELSSAMDMKFYAMLNAEEQKENKVSLFVKLATVLQAKLVKQLVYTFAILMIGFFVGSSMNFEGKETIKTLSLAQNETEDVRSQLVLALLEQPSVNKRLQAVNEASKLSSVTQTITKALFSTLNNDTNVNVRLSAIEALSNYTDMPEVREGLIASIGKQESPLVQIALADLMVVLQEKKAIKSFKKLIEKEDVNESAKEKMKESIERII